MNQPLALEVLANTTAMSSHRLVLVAAASFGSQENPDVFPTIDSLAKRAGMAPSAVRDHLAELLKVGEIERVGKRGRATVYRITCRWRSMPDYNTLPAAVNRHRKRRKAAPSETAESAVNRRRGVPESAVKRRRDAPDKVPHYVAESAVKRNRKVPQSGVAIKNRQRDPSGSLTPPAPPYSETPASTTTVGEYRPDGLVGLKPDQSVNGVPAAEEERRLALAESVRAALAELIDTGKLRPTLAALGWNQARDGQVSAWLQSLPPAKLTAALKVARTAQRKEART
jgi:hypothetical protein